MSEKFTNFATSTLNGSINSSVTSLIVASGSSFPSSGNFRILVDHEIMLVTARSGNTLTVIRGSESSTAANHANGVLVSHILTAGGFTQAVSENQGAPGYLPSAVPSLGVFTSADFTQINVGSRTITDLPGKINIRVPAVLGFDVLVLTRPMTTTCTMAFTMTSVGSGSFSEASVGLGLYNTGEVCFENYRVLNLGGTGMVTDSLKMTDPTTQSGAIQGQVGCGVSDVYWLRVHDEGPPFGDFVFSFSNNGRDFVEALRLFRLSSSLFASPPPDHWCIALANHNNTLHDLVVNIIGWTE